MTNLVPVSMLSAVAVHDHTLEGWTLLDAPDAAPRTFQLEVKFEKPFAAPPLVHVDIVGLDVSNRDNLRVRASATTISTHGFTVEVQTWFHTEMTPMPSTIPSIMNFLPSSPCSPEPQSASRRSLIIRTC